MHDVLEPCAGGGDMTKILQQHGYNVTSSDIVDRGLEGIIVKDVFDWQKLAR